VGFDARILVVEDNVINQEVATGILEAMSCRVVTAPNGHVAVQRMIEEKFDLVLMDCEMPVMDGFEATRCIREIEAKRVRQDPMGADAHTPIVALTAHALAEVRERCLESGMDDFLVKPFEERQMVDMLGRWLTPIELEATPAIPAAPPAAPPAATPPVARIDMVAIDKIRTIAGKNGASLLERVISQFGEMAPALASAIRTHREAGDPEAMWRVAHNLNSSAAAVGAHIVSARSAEIEAMGRTDARLPPQDLVEALQREVAAAIGDLHALVATEAAAA
jgi:CheY-like chemotaxis protein